MDGRLFVIDWQPIDSATGHEWAIGLGPPTLDGPLIADVQECNKDSAIFKKLDHVTIQQADNTLMPAFKFRQFKWIKLVFQYFS